MLRIWMERQLDRITEQPFCTIYLSTVDANIKVFHLVQKMHDNDHGPLIHNLDDYFAHSIIGTCGFRKSFVELAGSLNNANQMSLAS